MHQPIKDFHLEGIVTSDKFVNTRERLLKEVESGMRDEGYVPVLDLPEQFTRSFNAEDNTFDFHITIYGIYVGEESWQLAGIMNGLPVHKHTQPTK